MRAPVVAGKNYNNIGAQCQALSHHDLEFLKGLIGLCQIDNIDLSWPQLRSEHAFQCGCWIEMGIIEIAPRDRLPEKSNPPFAPLWFDPLLIRPIEPLISAIWQSNERGFSSPAVPFPDSHLQCVRASYFNGNIIRVGLRAQNSSQKK